MKTQTEIKRELKICEEQLHKSRNEAECNSCHRELVIGIIIATLKWVLEIENEKDI